MNLATRCFTGAGGRRGCFQPKLPGGSAGAPRFGAGGAGRGASRHCVRIDQLLWSCRPMGRTAPGWDQLDAALTATKLDELRPLRLRHWLPGGAGRARRAPATRVRGVGTGRCAFRSPRLVDGCGIFPHRVPFRRPLTCQFHRGTSSKATSPSGVCGISVLRSRCPPRRRTGPCPQTRLDSIRPHWLVNLSRQRTSCH